MSDKEPENPAAFPFHDTSVSQHREEQTYHTGMTLRDYFAGQALVGILATNPNMPKGISDVHKAQLIMATNCYNFADAMLKTREAK